MDDIIVDEIENVSSYPVWDENFNFEEDKMLMYFIFNIYDEQLFAFIPIFIEDDGYSRTQYWYLRVPREISRHFSNIHYYSKYDTSYLKLSKLPLAGTIDYHLTFHQALFKVRRLGYWDKAYELSLEKLVKHSPDRRIGKAEQQISLLRINLTESQTNLTESRTEITQLKTENAKFKQEITQLHAKFDSLLETINTLVSSTSDGVIKN